MHYLVYLTHGLKAAEYRNALGFTMPKIKVLKEEEKKIQAKNVVYSRNLHFLETYFNLSSYFDDI